METGSISQKIQRGKHTTRHAELFCVEGDTYLMDTPGFSSMYLEEIEPEKLKYYFPEFEALEPECRFQACLLYTSRRPGSASGWRIKADCGNGCR